MRLLKLIRNEDTVEIKQDILGIFIEEEEVMNENILEFVSDDVSQEFIQDVLKEALIEKLKDYSVEDILKLLQSE